jgi:hypothetical protein
MSRTSIDAADPRNIPKSSPQYIGSQLVGGYLTGTPGALWRGQWAGFPGKTLFTIDQGSTGAPQYNANVMDVEPGAYKIGDIVEWTSKCTAPRPTVYCDRDDYPTVRKVWSGDIWLAAPGITQPPAGYTGLIGIQNMAGSGYDLSVIFDDYWPNLAPTPTPTPPAPTPTTEADMINGTLAPGGKTFVPFPAGTFKSIDVMHDFTTDPLVVRVAMHSASKGYTQVVMHAITGSVPESIAFTESDVNGVSLASVAGDTIGFTLA